MRKLTELYRMDLPHRAISVYIYLSDRANKENICWPSIPTISKDLKLSESTTRRALKDLRKATFHEEMIRQIVHTVKVMTKNLIIVYLYDGTEIKQEVLQYFSPDASSEEIRRWNRNGNTPTKAAYLKLKAREQRAILEYLQTLPTHLELTINGQDFYLVHGFPAENVHDEVWLRPSMDAPNPKPGYQVIVGHTKVLSLIQPEEERIAFATDLENRGEHLKIYHGPGFIDVDCGCGYDMPIKKLACIRLEDMLEYYK